MADDLIRVVTGSLSAFVALVVLRAVLHKAADPGRFEGVLADYDLMPDRALPWMRMAIPCFEFACVLALAWGGSQRIGGYATGLLLMIYAAAIGVNLVRGRHEIDCGCGGAPEPISWALVIRNVALSAMLVPVVLGHGQPASVSELLASWAIALVGACCWGAAEQMLVNQARMGTARREMLNGMFGAAS